MTGRTSCHFTYRVLQGEWTFKITCFNEDKCLLKNWTIIKQNFKVLTLESSYSDLTISYMTYIKVYTNHQSGMYTQGLQSPAPGGGGRRGSASARRWAILRWSEPARSSWECGNGKPGFPSSRWLPSNLPVSRI